MDYFDAAKFYPAFSSEDKVRLYSVFGGIPFYNRLIDQSQSVRDNIIELVTEPGARLESEVPSYLGAEISKMTNANEVFGALAQGYVTLGRCAGAVARLERPRHGRRARQAHLARDRPKACAHQRPYE